MCEARAAWQREMAEKYFRLIARPKKAMSVRENADHRFGVVALPDR
jgi:hypothetical protein